MREGPGIDGEESDRVGQIGHDPFRVRVVAAVEERRGRTGVRRIGHRRRTHRVERLHDARSRAATRDFLGRRRCEAEIEPREGRVQRIDAIDDDLVRHSVGQFIADVQHARPRNGQHDGVSAFDGVGVRRRARSRFACQRGDARMRRVARPEHNLVAGVHPAPSQRSADSPRSQHGDLHTSFLITPHKPLAVPASTAGRVFHTSRSRRHRIGFCSNARRAGTFLEIRFALRTETPPTTSGSARDLGGDWMTSRREPIGNRREAVVSCRTKPTAR